MTRPEPSERLSSSAPLQWMLEAALWAAPMLIAAISARQAIDGIDGFDPPALLTALIVPAAAIAALSGVVVAPILLARNWRYAVSDAEISLRHGTFTVVHTIVPMARIQHVETRRSLLSSMFSTANLVLHTAGGSALIPHLDDAVAASLRDRIALLAQTPDEDDDR